MHMNRRILIGIGTVIALVIIGVLVYFFIREQGAEDIAPTQEDADVTVEQAEEPKKKIIYGGPRKAPPPDPSDLDGDGLDDEVEKNLGTSIRNSDTDGDGISDKDEVERWNTDPTKKDTDGDGFADFFEITNGYSPLGEGLLTEA